jgi:phosphoribosylamine---glycine ligase
MKVLIIGSGGREHALGWKLDQSPRVEEIFFAPGNPGTALAGTNVPITANDIDGLLAFAKSHDIGLTIVGPEDPLIAGIVDTFQEAGLRIFGPTKAAARIEGSKAFAKELMNVYRIPTAASRTFTDYNQAVDFARSIGRCFVKASGPAFGKGAIPCESSLESENALKALMIDGKFGDAGKTVIIERYLSGVELSVHAICKERNYVLFPFARDHKRALDGDQGENTGGMGTVAPVPANISSSLIIKEIIDLTLAALYENRSPYDGSLFAGIMDTPECGPMVLEYNARFGDPETQVYMPLLDSDLLDLMTTDNFFATKVKWRSGSAVCVVLASGGYPGPYEKGKVITGIEEAEQVPGVTVFHAGTKIVDGKLVTSGGRVLGVTCYAETLELALEHVYAAVNRIHFDGMHYRRDIGHSLLQKTQTAS